MIVDSGEGVVKESGTKLGYGSTLGVGSWKPIQKTKDPRIQRRIQALKEKALKEQEKKQLVRAQFSPFRIWLLFKN